MKIKKQNILINNAGAGFLISSTGVIYSTGAWGCSHQIYYSFSASASLLRIHSRLITISSSSRRSLKSVQCEEANSYISSMSTAPVVSPLSTTPYVYNDSNYKRVQYTRYADDFIIGVIGSKADAEAIKKDVKIFLQKALKLEMSDTKTKVTHTGNRARFLGYDITVSRAQTLQKASNGRVQRCQTGVVKLYVPREKWVGKLIEYKAMKIKINENGKERFVALHRGKLVNQSDIEILARYNENPVCTDHSDHVWTYDRDLPIYLSCADSIRNYE